MHHCVDSKCHVWCDPDVVKITGLFNPRCMTGPGDHTWRGWGARFVMLPIKYVGDCVLLCKMYGNPKAMRCVD